jgi:hypothetical protein
MQQIIFARLKWIQAVRKTAFVTKFGTYEFMNF